MFELNLKFPDRNKTDLDTLNRILAGVAFKKINISFESYHRTTTTRDPQGFIISVDYSCGFDTIQITGYQKNDPVDSPSEKLQHYQFYTDYLPSGQTVDKDNYIRLWKKAHPQYAVNIYSITINNDGSMSYIIAYTVD